MVEPSSSQNPDWLVEFGTVADFKKWAKLGWDYDNGERLRFFHSAILNDKPEMFKALLKWALGRDAVHGFEKGHPRAFDFFSPYHIEDKGVHRVVNLLLIALEKGSKWALHSMPLSPESFKNLPPQASGYNRGYPLPPFPSSWTPWVCLRKSPNSLAKIDLIPYLMEKGLELPHDTNPKMESSFNVESLEYAQWMMNHTPIELAFPWLKALESLGVSMSAQHQSNRVAPLLYGLKYVPFASLDLVKSLQKTQDLHLPLHDCHNLSGQAFRLRFPDSFMDHESYHYCSEEFIAETKTPAQWLWVFWWHADLKIDQESMNEVVQSLNIFKEEKILPSIEWCAELETQYLNKVQVKGLTPTQEWLKIQLEKFRLEGSLMPAMKNTSFSRI